MRGNWNGALTEVWDSYLDLATGLAEGYARFTSRGCGGCRRPGCSHCFAPPHCRSEGDFLADWIHLNLNYASQVARLGSAYTSVAVRGLERLYSCFDPCEPQRAHHSHHSHHSHHAHQAGCYELRLLGRSGGSALGVLAVRNSLPSPELFSIEGDTGSGVSVSFTEVGSPTSTQVGTLKVAQRTTPLAPDERVKLAADLDLKTFTAGKQYRGALIAKLGSGGRSIVQVVLDVL